MSVLTHNRSFKRADIHATNCTYTDHQTHNNKEKYTEIHKPVYPNTNHNINKMLTVKNNKNVPKSKH